MGVDDVRNNNIVLVIIQPQFLTTFNSLVKVVVGNSSRRKRKWIGAVGVFVVFDIVQYGGLLKQDRRTI